MEAKDVRNLISLTVDMENILAKMTDKSFKIYQAKSLVSTRDFLILGINKGLVIMKFDDIMKPNIQISPILSEFNNRNFIMYKISDTTCLYEHTLKTNLDEKNPDEVKDKALTVKQSDRVILNCCFNSKNLISSYYDRFKLAFSFDFSFLSTLDITNNTFSVHSLKINEELKYNCVSIHNGSCCDLAWCAYDNIFAITKFSLGIDEKNPKNAANVFSLEVYQLSLSGGSFSCDLLYSVKDLASHKIYGGHFIGVFLPIVREGTKDVFSFPGTYSKFTYETKEQYMQFFNWKEKEKMRISYTEEPRFILSSSDLEYMVTVFQTKYVCYKLFSKESSGNSSLSDSSELKPLDVYHYDVLDGYLYENFVFVFMTDQGVYFQVLNNRFGATYPIKLLGPSHEFSYYNLKIYRRDLNTTHRVYSRKPYPQRIVGISSNKLILASFNSEIELRDLEHILLKLIYFLTKRRITDLTAHIDLLEKKYIKYLLNIIDYFFPAGEEVFRFFFKTREVLYSLDLFKYLEFFMFDFAMFSALPHEVNLCDKILRNNLVKSLIRGDAKGVQDIYTFANKNSL